MEQKLENKMGTGITGVFGLWAQRIYGFAGSRLMHDFWFRVFTV